MELIVLAVLITDFNVFKQYLISIKKDAKMASFSIQTNIQKQNTFFMLFRRLNFFLLTIVNFFKNSLKRLKSILN
jgi:hypothetical protein